MRRALSPPMLPVPMRIASTRRETRDTVTLRIDSRSAPRPFLPGQFNMLYVFAVGEAAVSVSGDPARGDEVVHTVKAVGAVTAALCKLRRGDVVGVRGPYGNPWPLGELGGRDLLFVAGGVGLAPLRPALYRVLSHREKFGRVRLLFGARTPEDLPFRRELGRWESRADVEVLTIVDRAEAGWRGRVGVVPALLDETPLEPDRTSALLCGPEVMMRFTVRELRRLGVPSENIFVALERNMKCAVGFCGHCQYGPEFLCKDGPVFRFDRIEARFWRREV